MTPIQDTNFSKVLRELESIQDRQKRNFVTGLFNESSHKPEIEIKKAEAKKDRVFNLVYPSVDESLLELMNSIERDITASIDNEIYGWSKLDDDIASSLSEAKNELIISAMQEIFCSSKGKIEKILIEKNDYRDIISKLLDGQEVPNAKEVLMSHIGGFSYVCDGPYKAPITDMEAELNNDGDTLTKMINDDWALSWKFDSCNPYNIGEFTAMHKTREKITGNFNDDAILCDDQELMNDLLEALHSLK